MEYVLYYREPGGIARIPMSGQVTKGDSSFGGINSVRSRRAVRKAVADDQVTAILLHIDSPGGTVAGTGDLAADIAKANTIKPVYTFFEDLGASAAYWIGSQARYIFANPTADVGSIGTMTYVEDTSKMYEMKGIKVTLIATGKYKGQWIDGNPVSEDYIESIRTEVEDLNEHFLAGVLAGRTKMSREQLMAVADGRCFIASKAKSLGLIDEVASLDAAMLAITKELPMTSEQFRAFAAEHPDDPAVKALRDSAFAEGKSTGMSDGRKAGLIAAVAILGVFGLADHPATASIKAGDDEATAKRIADAQAAAKAEAEKSAKTQSEALAAANAENERLKAEIGTQGALNLAGAAKRENDKQAAQPVVANPNNPEAQAKDEWKANTNKCQDNFLDEATYVAFRKVELKGRVSTTKLNKE
jgi:signal peptide peptidase SppA